MRLLITIPHYYHRKSEPGVIPHGATSDPVEFRQRALRQCILSLHQHFGSAQYMMQIASRRTCAANTRLKTLLHVVVLTTEGRHLLNDLKLPAEFFHHHTTRAEPMRLGFECHKILRDRWGNYDFFGYLEDDLILSDPWLFLKLKWFQGFAGADAVLLPNRFERGTEPLVNKAYIDGDLAERVTARFQDINEKPHIEGTWLDVPVYFKRPLNPHSGCFFLTKEQMAHWMGQPYFLDGDASFVGPLESAATLGIQKAFRIYKPAVENASFLEIEHAGSRFLSKLRPQA